jgi:hypothetical protein
MNGLKILSSTRLLVQTTLPTSLTRHQPAAPLFDTTGQLAPLTLRADPPSEQQVHSKVSLRRAVDAVQRGGVAVFEPASGFGEAATTCKQPVNLKVEGAEESLSTLPDYTPTVRPPPKRS